MGKLYIRGGPVNITLNGIESIDWTYNLRTYVTDTVGGKVVQILGVDISDVKVQSQLGSGAKQELMDLVKRVRQIILWHSRERKHVTVTYPARNYKFTAYLESVTFKESLDDITYPFTLLLAVDEDINGNIKTTTISKELRRLSEGIGYEENEYNTPRGPEQETGPKGNTSTDEAVRDGNALPGQTVN